MKNTTLNKNIVITELRHAQHKIYNDVVNTIIDFYNYNNNYNNVIDYVKDLLIMIDKCNKNIDYMTTSQLIDYLIELI